MSANANQDELLEEIRLLGIAFNEEFDARKSATSKVQLLQNALRNVLDRFGNYKTDKGDCDAFDDAIQALKETEFEYQNMEPSEFAKKAWKNLVEIVHHD